MTGMTPERLRAIEDRLSGPIHPGVIVRDTLDLLDEVRRLRSAIKALAGEWSAPSPCDGHGMRAPIDPDHAARRLRNLLNPTEGEDR